MFLGQAVGLKEAGKTRRLVKLLALTHRLLLATHRKRCHLCSVAAVNDAAQESTWRRSRRCSGYCSSSSRVQRAAWHARASSACSPPCAAFPFPFPAGVPPESLSESLPLPLSGELVRLALDRLLDLDRFPCLAFLPSFSWRAQNVQLTVNCLVGCSQQSVGCNGLAATQKAQSYGIMLQVWHLFLFALVAVPIFLVRLL